MLLLSNSLDRASLKPGDHIYSWRTAYIYAHHGIYIGNNKVFHFTRRGQEVGTGTVLDILLVSSCPQQSLTPCTSCTQTHTNPINGVISSCLDCFLSGGSLYRFEYSVTPAVFLAARGGTCTLAASNPQETVINRANYLLNNGFGRYDVFKNNCEHFAIYCKTGLLVVDERAMGQSGQAASIFGRPLAAVLPTNVRGMVATVVERTMGRSGQAASIVGVLMAAVVSSTLRPVMKTNVFGMAATAVSVYCASHYEADFGTRSDVVEVPLEELTRRLEVGTVIPRLMIQNS